jgi:hypothetical protein
MQVQDTNSPITDIDKGMIQKTYSNKNVRSIRGGLAAEVARPYLQGSLEKPTSIITPQTTLTEDLKNLFGPKLDETIALYNLNPTPENKKKQNQLKRELAEAAKWIKVIQDMLPSNEVKTSPSILTDILKKILNKS